jgi:hypothetical protein
MGDHDRAIAAQGAVDAFGDLGECQLQGHGSAHGWILIICDLG